MSKTVVSKAIYDDNNSANWLLRKITTSFEATAIANVLDACVRLCLCLCVHNNIYKNTSRIKSYTYPTIWKMQKKNCFIDFLQALAYATEKVPHIMRTAYEITQQRWIYYSHKTPAYFVLTTTTTTTHRQRKTHMHVCCRVSSVEVICVHLRTENIYFNSVQNMNWKNHIAL